jgi:hypothetical protein
METRIIPSPAKFPECLSWGYKKQAALLAEGNDVSKDLQLPVKATRNFRAIFPGLEGQYARRIAHLPLRQLVLRMRRKPRVDNAFDGRV